MTQFLQEALGRNPEQTQVDPFPCHPPSTVSSTCRTIGGLKTWSCFLLPLGIEEAMAQVQGSGDLSLWVSEGQARSLCPVEWQITSVNSRTTRVKFNVFLSWGIPPTCLSHNKGQYYALSLMHSSCSVGQPSSTSILEAAGIKNGISRTRLSTPKAYPCCSMLCDLGCFAYPS